MTNVIQDAYVLQTRQAIFMRLSRIADEKFIPVLDVAIDEIASRDAEVAKAFEDGRQAEREECAGICDMFGEREMHPAECAGAIRARSTK